MDALILELAALLFGASYVKLLAVDLNGYSTKDKEEALAELRAEAASKGLTDDQRRWLVNAG